MWSMALVALLTLTLPTLATARTWHVPGDAPTIQEGIDLAAPGDDVLVAAGVYPEHDIGMRSGVWLHSEQGSSVTVIDAESMGRVFSCIDFQETTTIEGFTILNGNAQNPQQDAPGGAVRCMSSDLVIRGCVVTSCSAQTNGGGIYAWGSELVLDACSITGCLTSYAGGGVWAYGPMIRITDCEIAENVAGSSGGVSASSPECEITRCVISNNVAVWGSAGGIGCAYSEFAVRDCLIIGNESYDFGEAGGVGIGYSSGLIEGCTVVGNGGIPAPASIHIGYSSVVEIDRTIIAFNEGRGLYCEAYESQVEVGCCDLYGNSGGNAVCGDDLGGNFSEDPLFCDPENDDYTLDGCSPCLPGNHPDGVDCGLIGALGQGCGATAVEETSWGRIKSLYRR